MQEIMRKSLIKDIDSLITILKNGNNGIRLDHDALNNLSDHTVKDVALYKNMDAVSLAVLTYSISKVYSRLSEEKKKDLLTELSFLRSHLVEKNLPRYNKSLQILFEIIKCCTKDIKGNVHNVLYAAKINKTNTLLEHGLSVARAARAMGLSQWEILNYNIGKNLFENHNEKISPIKRLEYTIKLFNSKPKKNQEKILFFDAGPIITLAMARLLWVLKPLKEKFNGRFYITEAVRKEIVENPINIRKFKFEALQVMKLIRDGIIEIYPKKLSSQVKSITDLSNQTYQIKGKWIEIIQTGEIETVYASSHDGPKYVVIDERTIRLLIENGKELKSLLERRTRKEVTLNMDHIKEFNSRLGKIKIIRSIELIGLAYILGILNEYLPVELNEPKKVLLESVLWDVKYNGCAVTDHEVIELKDYLLEIS